ncbi:hypothetical protein niasHT_023104 [Heterodera trifolii]|uniref:Phosphoglycerate mutase n=1 Tax=Heterodera trifolii TaxID=157864 RepID=A0ABD2KFR2_9BILA
MSIDTVHALNFVHRQEDHNRKSNIIDEENQISSIINQSIVDPAKYNLGPNDGNLLNFIKKLNEKISTQNKELMEAKTKAKEEKEKMHERYLKDEIGSIQLEHPFQKYNIITMVLRAQNITIGQYFLANFLNGGNQQQLGIIARELQLKNKVLDHVRYTEKLNQFDAILKIIHKQLTEKFNYLEERRSKYEKKHNTADFLYTYEHYTKSLDLIQSELKNVRFEWSDVKNINLNDFWTVDQRPTIVQTLYLIRHGQRLDNIKEIGRDWKIKLELTKKLSLSEMSKQELPLPELSDQGVPLSKMSKQDLPLSELSTQEMPLSEMSKQELPLSETSTQELPLSELSEQGVPASKMSKQDVPLSKLGFKQAKELGEWFKSIPIDQIYSSPFQRTVATANGILEGRKDAIYLNIEPGLTEFHRPCIQRIDYLNRNDSYKIFKFSNPNYSPVYNKRLLELEITGRTSLKNPKELENECNSVVEQTLRHILNTNKNAKHIVLVSHLGVIALIHELLTGEWVSVGQTTVSKFVQYAEKDSKNVDDELKRFRLEYSSGMSHLTETDYLRPH